MTPAPRLRHLNPLQSHRRKLRCKPDRFTDRIKTLVKRPDLRARPAGARPHPSAAAGSRLPGAPNPSSTPLRDLIGVRTASQVTPLSGNVRKRQNNALLSQQQQSPTRSSTTRAPADSSSTSSSDSGSAAPASRVKTPTSLLSPAPPAAAQAQAQQAHSPPQGPPQPAAAAASLPLAQGTPSPSRPVDARPTPTIHSGSSTLVKNRKKPPSKRLHDYRLLGSPSTSAFDVAARGGLKDNRVFAVLADDHPTRVKPYWEVQNLVNDALVDVGAEGRVATVDAVKTGLALTLTRTSRPQEVLQHAEAIKLVLSAEKVALRKPAITMVVADVPVRVNDTVVDDDDLFLLKEIELALDESLACPPRRLCKDEDLDTRKTTAVWIAIDPDSPAAARPRRLRIMQHWCHLRPFVDRSTPLSCTLCWSYGHSHDACTHSPRCQRCGSLSHSIKEHTCDLCGGKDPCVPICIKCTGPHLPDDKGCKAKPIFDSAVNGFVIPAGQRLHRIKQDASRARREVVKNLTPAS